MRIKIHNLIATARLIMCALSLLAGSGAMALEAEQGPLRGYLVAYDSMKLGDWLSGQDMNEEAVELYEEALGMFQDLASEYPSWQSNVIAYRITYCSNQLEKIGVPVLTPAKPGLKDTAPRQMAIKNAQSAEKEAEGPEESAYAGVIQAAVRLERVPDLKRAIELYSTVLAQQPTHIQALKGAVRCHLHMGSIDTARALLRKGVVGRVSDSDLHLLMALVECYDQQFDRAIQLLRLSLEENRVNADAHVAMGIALVGQGRLDDAKEEMKRALSLNSKISEAYYNLAWISLKENPGNIAVVRTHYQNALRYGGAPDPLLEKLLN